LEFGKKCYLIYYFEKYMMQIEALFFTLHRDRYGFCKDCFGNGKNSSIFFTQIFNERSKFKS
jgi:hypothetical protein